MPAKLWLIFHFFKKYEQHCGVFYTMMYRQRNQTIKTAYIARSVMFTLMHCSKIVDKFSLLALSPPVFACCALLRICYCYVVAV